MVIESYSFGSITIGGTNYRKDVIVFPGRVLSPWWRKDGHSLSPEDLGEVVEAAPELLIVGKGANGVMKVPSETIAWLKERGIETVSDRTANAVEIYNRAVEEGKKVVAALHLTC